MVKILQHHTVVRDGFHNMLTDLAYWRDYYWLTYRRVSGHYSPDGGTVVLRSVDLKRWHKVAFLKTEGNDWVPKLCVTKNRLFVYFVTSYPFIEGPRTKDGDLLSKPKKPIYRTSQTCFSDDGTHWSKPTPVLQNRWIWKVHYNEGTFFTTAYGWQGDMHDHIHGPLELLTSKDGVNWTKLSTIAGVEDGPNEADLHFQPDGEIWVIARTWREPTNHSLFFSSRPPYQEWERVDLKVLIGPPIFCESGGILYVAGRRDLKEPWIPQSIPPGSTAIYTVERGKVTPFFALPSVGDSGYPGIISQKPDRLLISYYSQHAYLSGVLSSEIPLPSFGTQPDILIGDDDIYLMEIAIK